MRVAILGTRGIPARYGGFETFAEELGSRLVERGHEVFVYCRTRSAAKYHRGVELVYLPTIRHKYLDTVFHTWISTLHLLGKRADCALYCNAANAIFTLLPRAVGIPTALNVDGIERRRRKWGWPGKAWYWLSERLALRFPNVTISDARIIQTYYRQRYGKETVVIPYGAPVGKLTTKRQLERLGLEAEKYFLYVSRLEPENNALLVREAYERVDSPLRLVLVGDAPYARSYVSKVRDTRDKRILIPGAIYGDGYHELLSHCYAYIHATEVGGTHPALVEALGRGCLTLYLDTPENREVAEGAGIPFTKETLSRVLNLAAEMSEGERRQWQQKAMVRAREHYNWDHVTDAYERLLLQLCGKAESCRLE